MTKRSYRKFFQKKNFIHHVKTKKPIKFVSLVQCFIPSAHTSFASLPSDISMIQKPTILSSAETMLPPFEDIISNDSWSQSTVEEHILQPLSLIYSTYQEYKTCSKQNSRPVERLLVINIMQAQIRKCAK